MVAGQVRVGTVMEVGEVKSVGGGRERRGMMREKAPGGRGVGDGKGLRPLFLSFFVNR